MAQQTPKLPEFQDDVRHREQQDEVGVVIAKYPIEGKQFLDVRMSDDRIVYKTPAENWETTRTEEERW